MDAIPPSEHLSYVRCSFCNTVLAVGVPCKRSLDSVTVKCGHCSNLFFLTTRPPLQGPGSSTHHHNHHHHHHHMGGFQGFRGDHHTKGQTSSSPSSSNHPINSQAPYVVKPPERKHRLPSAYNRFMKEEIQRIKAAQPEIPHREAFSTAAKNAMGEVRATSFSCS
ncbi:hypothetical protein Sjap_024046 [Stephania japonica]|uniref:Crabs claw n=1 Tax=Stephania japonica TaxID=461633 RepID=A0AAP0HL47_9MAGN